MPEWPRSKQSILPQVPANTTQTTPPPLSTHPHLLSRRIPPINRQIHARHPPRIITRQKHIRPSQILRPADAPKRMHRLDLLHRLFIRKRRIRHMRRRIARVDGVDVDAMCSAVQGRGAREVRDGAFGCACIIIHDINIETRVGKKGGDETYNKRSQTDSPPYQTHSPRSKSSLDHH